MTNYITWHKKEPRKNKLTWRGATRQKEKEALADKKRKTQELKFKQWSLLERTAALAELAYMQEVDRCAHLVGSLSNKRLAAKYSKAACQMAGRAIDVWIRTPSSKESSGQFTRTKNKGHIQLDPGLDARSTVSVFLHELCHVALHWDSIKASKLHLRSPRTLNCTGKSPNRPANYDKEENEADELRDEMIALLDLYVDPLKPDYENRALDWLILDSS